MITPVVLVSAYGTLLLSTANRLARVADRVETWSDEMAVAASSLPDTPLVRDRHALILAQLGLMTWRAHLLPGAMTALYLAVFVAAMVAIGIVAFTHAAMRPGRPSPWLSLGEGSCWRAAGCSSPGPAGPGHDQPRVGLRAAAWRVAGWDRNRGRAQQRQPR